MEITVLNMKISRHQLSI